MKLISVFLIVIGVIFSPILAQPINDVAKGDGSYSAISRSINQGYLSLFSDQTFRPDYALSRRDAVLIVDKLLLEMRSNQISLTSLELKELQLLSDSFKETFVSTSNDVVSLRGSVKSIQSEQTVLQNDVSSLTEQINGLNKERRLLYGLIAGAGLLGVLF